MDLSNDSDGFDSGTYGRSFADVYDLWYPPDTETTKAVETISSIAGPGSRILELGVGTGRLAIPLAESGHDLWGIDSSAEMLALLDQKAHAGGLRIGHHCGDVSADSGWPDQQFDLIVAAFNLVFNLDGHDAQRQLFQIASRHLSTRGALLIEAFVPDTPPEPVPDTPPEPAHGAAQTPERKIELRSLSADAVVLIASVVDTRTGTVTGQHIELRDGSPVRLRPWKIHMAGPEQLDDFAESAGLRLEDRYADWERAPFVHDSVRHVSIYRPSRRLSSAPGTTQ